MFQKFHEGQKVQLKSGFKFKPDVYKVFGYSNPGYDDLVYIIDKKSIITTVPESSLEPVYEKMKYKVYTSTIEWSEEDQVFHGHIEGILALVTWEADEEKKCQKEFELAVEDYIALCNDLGVDPKKDLNPDKQKSEE